MPAILEVGLEVKENFFDRQKVKNSMDTATHESMSKAAASIRRISQTLMHYVGKNSKIVSSPGQPPRARHPHPNVRRFLFYFYDRRTQSAVIGPIRLPNTSDTPHSLEFGAKLSRKNLRRRKRVIGSAGEIRIGGKTCRSTKTTKDYMGRPFKITYAKIRTEAEAQESNRINQFLYGPETITGTLEPRPFMGPALKKEEPQMPSYWKDSLRSA